MANCPSCRRAIPDDARLCPYCGVKLTEQTPARSAFSISPSLLRSLVIMFSVWSLVCAFCTLSSYFVGARTSFFRFGSILDPRPTATPTPPSWLDELDQPSATPDLGATITPGTDQLTPEAIPSPTPVLTATIEGAGDNPLDSSFDF